MNTIIIVAIICVTALVCTSLVSRAITQVAVTKSIQGNKDAVNRILEGFNETKSNL